MTPEEIKREIDKNLPKRCKCANCGYVFQDKIGSRCPICNSNAVDEILLGRLN